MRRRRQTISGIPAKPLVWVVAAICAVCADQHRGSLNCKNSKPPWVDPSTRYPAGVRVTIGVNAIHLPSGDQLDENWTDGCQIAYL